MANYPELDTVPDPPEDAYEWRSNSTGIDFYLPTQSSAANIPKTLAYFAESISKDQVYDDAYLPTVGGTMTGDINLGGNTISNSAEPDAAQDVATRNYVDLADATKANIAGDAFQGKVTVKSPLPDDPEGSFGARNIYLSTADPTNEGADGDIWVKYTP